MSISGNKQIWRSGNMLYPVPAVMVTSGIYPEKINVFTAAWAGTVCSDPAMTYVSIRPSRYSYELIKETGEFVINLTTRDLARACDTVGVISGRDKDKFTLCHLTPEKAEKVSAPLLLESPVNIECKVTQILPLGSHDMFLGEVLCVHVSESLLDKNGRLALEKADLITYSHGDYMTLGEKIGSFGYSVKKKSR